MSKRLTGRRRPFVRVGVAGMIAALLGVFGFAAGAWAGSAESPWDRFAEWGTGSGHRCAAHSAAVYTPPSVINAYGQIRYRGGDPCADMNAPSGYIGVREFLQRADGTICASRTWEYNDGPASAIYVPTNQGKGSCASWSSLRAAAMGRVYRASTAQYITASSYIYSPYAN